MSSFDSSTIDESTEDDDSESDEEYDICDPSLEAANRKTDLLSTELSNRIATVGAGKGLEGGVAPDDLAAGSALMEHTLCKESSEKETTKSQQWSTDRSGVNTPGRFAGPSHLPPARNSTDPSPTLLNPSDHSVVHSAFVLPGARLDVPRYQNRSSSRSRSHGRELEDNIQTPTIPGTIPGRRHHRGTSKDTHERQPCRAFAVWGNDESDSNISDFEDWKT